MEIIENLKFMVVGVGSVGLSVVYVVFICGFVWYVVFYDIVIEKVEVEVFDFVYGM